MESDSRSPTVPQLQKPVGRLPYAIAAASFIPFVGLPFGVIAIILGTARRTWGTLVLGASGLIFNLIMYFGLFQSGGLHGRMRAILAVHVLDSAVKDIEFYKQQHGRYPASLREVEPKDKKTLNNFIDPVVQTKRNADLNGRFYYQLDPSGNFYFLRSAGPDGIPFTDDDILPALSEVEGKNTGLRRQR